MRRKQKGDPSWAALIDISRASGERLTAVIVWRDQAALRRRRK